ncbi:hypothetical protein EV644_14233 [Kribbella orskensis]|uniref:Uncharacterized protein n=1 Tax=Kribbella orskensis TaxID=2512216 RepID=A0ABY2B6U2_9ACTN|nr:MULTISPECIES: hypothetical protein [Kribbella]TCN28891.1 hypothetical protein EV642_14533 [Kribbella sp. VKM Ac-2500]TCO09001.1 hypothetical protein EV644_14233 [Kribbella orskensis]
MQLRGQRELLKVLNSTTFDLLVLVGDVYQIESIQFGNWFSLARSYVPKESVFELTKPWRTDDEALLTLWDRVRSLDDRIEESLSKNGYFRSRGRLAKATAAAPAMNDRGPRRGRRRY